jgi:glycosyltransferase involved in cell wall biosynthesis
MKVVLINKSASGGGAAMACRRLLMALSKSGNVDTKILVQEYSGNNTNIISTTHSKFKEKLNFFRFVWERLCFLPYEKSKEIRFAFSLANTGEDISKLKVIKEADVIHLHWYNQGFLSLVDIQKLIELNKPIVWTLHDMWAYTGGCHYTGDCRKYETGCNLSTKLFKQKLKLLSNAKISFVGCSNWMASEAKKSTILRNSQIISIPNPIDTELCKPTNKDLARKEFNLPTAKKIILFGAAKVTDKRKGLDYLIQAIEQLAKNHNQEYLLVTFGKTKGMPEFAIESIAINFLNDENKIALLYNAADVFVVPSLEDNLPNTIMESLACGVPVVSFNTGGIPEMVDHKENGYLATLKDSGDLASGIEWVLENNEYSGLANAAREKVLKEYSEEIISKRYMDLYNHLIIK